MWLAISIGTGKTAKSISVQDMKVTSQSVLVLYRFFVSTNKIIQFPHTAKMAVMYRKTTIMISHHIGIVIKSSEPSLVMLASKSLEEKF